MYEWRIELVEEAQSTRAQMQNHSVQKKEKKNRNHSDSQMLIGGEQMQRAPSLQRRSRPAAARRPKAAECRRRWVLLLLLPLEHEACLPFSGFLHGAPSFPRLSPWCSGKAEAATRSRYSPTHAPAVPHLLR